MKKQLLLPILLLLLVISLIYFLLNSNNIDDIRIVTEEYPPLQYINKNGDLDGYATNIINATIEELGISKKIELLDWDKAYKLALEEENIALFSVIKTNERENNFKWVGPIGTLKVGLYRNYFDSFEIDSLEEAKEYKISAVKNYSYTEDLLSLGFENIVECNSEKEALEKLMSREVDFFLTSNIIISELIEKENIPFYAIEKEFNVSIDQFYIAFSKNYPDVLIKKWENALKKEKKNNTLLFIDK